MAVYVDDHRHPSDAGRVGVGLVASVRRLPSRAAGRWPAIKGGSPECSGPAASGPAGSSVPVAGRCGCGSGRVGGLDPGPRGGAADRGRTRRRQLS